MATVIGMTAASILALFDGVPSTAEVDANGDLIFTLQGGGTFNAGNVEGPPIAYEIAYKPATDLPDTYPHPAVTTMALGLGSSTGWPCVYGTVTTYILNTSRAYQLVMEKSTGNIWLRTSGDNTWGSFYQLASKAYVDAAVAAVQADADQNATDISSLEATVRGTEIGSGTNLDAFIQAGVYHQSEDGEASTALNYPVAKAGTLEVFYNGSLVAWQRYTPHANTTNVFYMRHNNVGIWKPWVKFTAHRNRKNLLPDLSTYSTGTLVNESGSRGSNPNVWSLWSITGTATASIQSDATAGTTGFGRFLALYSPAGYNQRVDSPVIDVVPGEKYVVRWKQGAIYTNTTPRQYFRIAGGSTAAMTEYPGNSSSAGIQPIGYYENVTMVDIGDTYGSADASLMVERSLSFEVPAGITKAAIAITQYQPTGSVTAIYKDFEFYRIDGDEAPSDTGWVSLCSQGGWDAEEALVRIKDDIFYMTGKFVPPSGYTATWNSPSALLPPFFADALTEAETTATTRGLRGWLSSTSDRFARMSLYAADHSSSAGYVNIEPSDVSSTYFEIVQMAVPMGRGS